MARQPGAVAEQVAEGERLGRVRVGEAKAREGLAHGLVEIELALLGEHEQKCCSEQLGVGGDLVARVGGGLEALRGQRRRNPSRARRCDCTRPADMRALNGEHLWRERFVNAATAQSPGCDSLARACGS